MVYLPYSYQKNQPNVDKYTLHGSYGIFVIHNATEETSMKTLKPIFVGSPPHPVTVFHFCPVDEDFSTTKCTNADWNPGRGGKKFQPICHAMKKTLVVQLIIGDEILPSYMGIISVYPPPSNSHK